MSRPTALLDRVPDGNPLGEHRAPTGRSRLWLGVVLVAALAVRLPLLVRELPDVYHPDEPTNANVLVEMLHRHTLNPHFFAYPSLFFYLHALPYLPARLVGSHAGLPAGAATVSAGLGMNHATDPAVFVLGRAVTTVTALAGIVLLYLAVRRLTGRSGPALAAAALLGLSPTFVENSGYLTPDVPATSAVALVLYLAVRADARPDRAAFALAGVGVGVATCLKYNAVLSGVLLVLVAVRHRRVRLLLTGAAATVGTFVVLTPYALLDPHEFVHQAGYEIKHYETGHPGAEGGSFSFYLHYLGGTEPVLLVGCLVGAALLARGRRWWPLGLLGAFPLLYGASVSSATVHFSRVLLLVLPPLAGLAGIALVAVADRIAGRNGQVRRLAVAGAACVAVVAVPSARSVAVDGRLNRLDNRAVAQRWLAGALPPGASVLAESYAPWLDPGRYRVRWVFSLDRTPAALLTGPDRVRYVLGSDRSSLYAASPHRYAAELAGYRRVLRELVPVRTFAGAGGAPIELWATR